MWYENGKNWLLNLVPFLSWNSFTRKLKVSSSLEESTHSRFIQLCWMCRHLRDNFRVFLFYFHFPHCPLDISVCHHTIHVDYPLHLSRVILLTPSLIPEESKKSVLTSCAEAWDQLDSSSNSNPFLLYCKCPDCPLNVFFILHCSCFPLFSSRPPHEISFL